MRRFHPAFQVWILLLFSMTITPASLFTQSIWTERLPGRSMTVEFLQPNFSGSSSSSGNFALFLTGRFPAWERTELVIDLPIARGSREGSMYFPEESNTIVGNPYLGVEIRGPDSPSFAEIGFRLPITPEDNYPAASAGTRADFDRREAFIRELFMVAIMGNYRIDPLIDHSFFRIRFGPNFWIGGGGIEILLDYSLQGGYSVERITFTTGFSGRLFVSADRGNLSERTFHQFGVAGSMNFGRFQPGLFLRIPIDEDLSESIDIDYVLGLSVGIAFD